VSTAVIDALKPQKTKSYEVGAKANVLNEKLALGLAVFQTEIQNARVTDTAGTAAFLGESRIRGAELTVNGTILPGWTVFGGYSFLDGKIGFMFHAMHGYWYFLLMDAQVDQARKIVRESGVEGLRTWLAERHGIRVGKDAPPR